MNGKKDKVAQYLAKSHAEMEDSISMICRVRSGREDDKTEPIKLLEVNSATVASGVIPVTFGPDREVPYPLVIMDVTPAEFRRIKAKRLRLPRGWRLGRVLYKR